MMRRAHFPWIAAAVVVLGASSGLVASELKAVAPDVTGPVVRLPAFDIKGERLEDFGFRVSHDFDVLRSKNSGRVYTPVVDVVLPNTAASKAGLRPGDRIISSDGEETASGSTSLRKWHGFQKKKWTEVVEGKENVTWVLQVETAGTWATRTLVLQLPTPAPHWGSTVWRAPEGRIPVVVPEPGPLAERAQEVLNNGVWVLLRGSYVRGFQLPTDAAQPNFLCYQWTLWSGSTGHRIYVSRQRGRTDIILEAIDRQSTGFFSNLLPTANPDKNFSSVTTVFAVDSRTYLTSPSGVLEKAWRLPLSNRQEEIPPGAARAGFEAEMDFWLKKVGKVSSLWPLEVIGQPSE